MDSHLQSEQSSLDKQKVSVGQLDFKNHLLWSSKEHDFFPLHHKEEGDFKSVSEQNCPI